MKTQFDPTFDPPAPIGIIMVRDIETGERSVHARMLLDTGADVTLLPRSLFGDLDASPSLESALSLAGFDGSTNIYRTVDTQIVFLGKRFTGVYCVIDDEIGILGRDVLNGMTIQFDGPALEWKEIKPTDELESIS